MNYAGTYGHREILKSLASMGLTNTDAADRMAAAISVTGLVQSDLFT
jgi:hypothetical protein